jgi:Fur family transcriptional regulator, ferric uptake regulator
MIAALVCWQMIASTPSNHPLGDIADLSRMGSPLDLACARLKSAGLRITQPRVAIIEALIRRDSPVSIEQLHQDLASDACDLVTVYRCLAVFEQLGLVRRCFFHNGTGLYEINLNDSHHHHIVCRTCGKVERIDASFTEGTERILHERGYGQVTKLVEFFGVCPDCQKKAAEFSPVSVSDAR